MSSEKNEKKRAPSPVYKARITVEVIMEEGDLVPRISVCGTCDRTAEQLPLDFGERFDYVEKFGGHALADTLHDLWGFEAPIARPPTITMYGREWTYKILLKTRKLRIKELTRQVEERIKQRTGFSRGGRPKVSIDQRLELREKLQILIAQSIVELGKISKSKVADWYAAENSTLYANGPVRYLDDCLAAVKLTWEDVCKGCEPRRTKKLHP